MFQFDTDTMRGLILVSLLVGFLGIWRWAWSSKRKLDFHGASRLPLEDDEVEVSSSHRKTSKPGTNPC